MDLIYNACKIFDLLCALAVYRTECFVVAVNNSVGIFFWYRHLSPFSGSKSLFDRVMITDSLDMTLDVGRGRKARQQTNERTNTRTFYLQCNIHMEIS